MEELERIRIGLEKAVGQGRKIETLTGMEEWKFFAGWLESTRDEITRRVMGGEFLGNQREEDFNKGIAEALRVVLDGAESFKTKAKDAHKRLQKLEESENE